MKKLGLLFSALCFSFSTWAQSPATPPTTPTPEPMSDTAKSGDEVQGTIVKPSRKQKKSMKQVAKKAKKNAKKSKKAKKAKKSNP